MTTWPTWAVYLLAFGSPVLAFIGVVAGVIISRRGDSELEKRSRREEVMRNLRWAAELAVAGDADKARLGMAHLRALLHSGILDNDGQMFVRAAIDAVVSKPARTVEVAQEAGLKVTVSTTASGVVGPGVASEEPGHAEDEGA